MLFSVLKNNKIYLANKSKNYSKKISYFITLKISFVLFFFSKNSFLLLFFIFIYLFIFSIVFWKEKRDEKKEKKNIYEIWVLVSIFPTKKWREVMVDLDK